MEPLNPPTPSEWPDQGSVQSPGAPTAHTPDGPAQRSRAGRGRRVLRTLAVLVLLATTVAGVAVGWQQRSIAGGWRERAVLLEQQRDDAVGRAEALSGQLGELSTLVQLSETDLAELEERLAELAGEKAQAEDRAVLSAEELRRLATLVDSAVSQLNACADDLLALQSDTVDAYNSVARGTPVDVAPLNERLAATSERCTAARQAGAEAVALASRLR